MSSHTGPSDNVSMAELTDMARDIAAATGLPFEQIQGEVQDFKVQYEELEAASGPPRAFAPGGVRWATCPGRKSCVWGFGPEPRDAAGAV